MKTNNTIEEIKKQIHTTNPEISDELLDLLYEFVSIKFREELKRVKTID